MSLKDQQKEFIEYLYAPNVSEAQQGRVRQMFLREDRPDPGNGLKVYRRNTLFGLLQALKETYRFTHALVGENNFNFLGREYIYAHPSRESDLTQYGGEFGDFLLARPEAAHLPFLSDAARLEWARDRAFYAPAEKALPLGEWMRFCEEEPSRLQLRLQSSVTLVETRYQVYGSSAAFDQGGLEALNENPFPPGEEKIVVWNEAGMPHQTLAGPETARLVQGLLKGRTLASIAAQEPFPQNARPFSRWVQLLVQQGWVADIQRI